MATFLALKTEIAGDLKRSNLTTEIAAAVQSAIAWNERTRFWFNETRSVTFNTVASQEFYGTADSTDIPNMLKIDSVFLRDGNNVYPLDRAYDAEQEEESQNATLTGRPTQFSYSAVGQIRLLPVPAAVYPMRIHGVKRLTALSADGDTNAWTTEAYELTRCTAKRFLYTHIIKDMEQAQIMVMAETAAKDQLLVETSQRRALGRIVPTEF